MLSSPLVSIIVPNYNHAKFLEQRLESIFKQTFQDFEVILLDDASKDFSRSILERYQTHPTVSHTIFNEKNSGSPFRQWKKGIDLAKGEYIWIAESDDYCVPDFIENIFKARKEWKGEPGLIYSQSIDVDQNGSIITSRINYTADFTPNIWEENFQMSGKYFVENFLKVKNVIPNASAVVFKRSLIDHTVFSEELLNMKLCGDWYFWIKLCSKTNIGFVSKPLNFFRDHINVSRNHNKLFRRLDRFTEEATIRNYLETNFSLNQKEEIDNLYKHWFAVHKLKSLLKREFYRVKVKKTSSFTFISKALLEKF